MIALVVVRSNRPIGLKFQLQDDVVTLCSSDLSTERE